MEEIKTVSINLFNWVIGGIGTVLSFLFGWEIRNTLRVNKLEQLMAANMEGDKARDKRIDRIETKMDSLSKLVRNHIEVSNKVLQDQKEMFNVVVSKNQKLEPLIKEQSKLIKEWLG